MKRRILETLAIGATLACASLPSSTASACDWDYCGEPADLIPADKTTIPANASLVWSPLIVRGDLDAALDALVLTDATGNEIDVELHEVDLPRFSRWGPAPRVLTPLEPLVPGTEYTLTTASTRCTDTRQQIPVQSVFVASDAEPLPDRLGTLTASALQRVEIALAEDGSCSYTQDVVSTDVELELSAEARPWAEAFVFETLVNDEFWGPAEFSGQGFPIGSSWVGRGQDRIFAICNDNPYSEHSYLLPGTHTVKIRAHLPGTDRVLESNELTLDFDCAAAGGEPDTGQPDTGQPDTGQPDTGQPNDNSEAPLNGSDSDGGCSTTSSSTPGPGLLLAILVALITLCRRGRRAA